MIILWVCVWKLPSQQQHTVKTFIQSLVITSWPQIWHLWTFIQLNKLLVIADAGSGWMPWGEKCSPKIGIQLPNHKILDRTSPNICDLKHFTSDQIMNPVDKGEMDEVGSFESMLTVLWQSYLVLFFLFKLHCYKLALFCLSVMLLLHVWIVVFNEYCNMMKM